MSSGFGVTLVGTVAFTSPLRTTSRRIPFDESVARDIADLIRILRHPAYRHKMAEQSDRERPCGPETAPRVSSELPRIADPKSDLERDRDKPDNQTRAHPNNATAPIRDRHQLTAKPQKIGIQIIISDVEEIWVCRQAMSFMRACAWIRASSGDLRAERPNPTIQG